jgi:hypothetical protein
MVSGTICLSWLESTIFLISASGLQAWAISARHYNIFLELATLFSLNSNSVQLVLLDRHSFHLKLMYLSWTPLFQLSLFQLISLLHFSFK